MSSTSSTEPVFRLVFDGMSLTLLAPDGSGPRARADLAAPDMGAQLARLASVAAKAPRGVIAVLPEAEIWRDAVRLNARTPGARHAEALAVAEEATGCGPDALDLMIGSRAPDGTFPVAAIRRASVIDALVFLDRSGIKAAYLTAGGEFPGFDTPPLFRVGGRDWPAEARALASRVTGVLASLPKAGTLATSLAAFMARGVGRIRTITLPRALPGSVASSFTRGAESLRTISKPKALAASGIAGALLLAALLPSGDAPAPDTTTVSAPTPATVAQDVIFPVAATPEPIPEAAPVEAAPAVVITPALAPRARPADLPTPAPEDVEAAHYPLPPAFRPTGRTDPRPVTIASRTTPVVSSALAASRPAGLTLAETPTARARASLAVDVAVDTIASVNPTAQAGVEAAAADVSAPVRDASPIAVAEIATPATAPSAAPVSGSRPLPRAVASTPDDLARTVSAALETVVTPEPAAAETEAPVTTASLPATPPEPRRIAAPAKASPAPIAVRAAVLAASAVPPAKAVAAPAPVVKPTPVVVARAAPAAVAKPTPKPAPVAKAAPAPSNRATSESVGLSRNSLSLLGVFGTSKDRYALLRMPNGSVKKVGAGDQIQGVRVAAVSGDAVRLTQGQRDTVLRMPD
jgi:hypothetical protein